MKLSVSELSTAHTFLRRAHLLVCDVASKFFNSGDSNSAARLRDIGNRLTDEIQHIDSLLRAPPSGGQS